MTKLLKVFLLGFLALGFVACDKVSEVVDSASKAVDTATKEGKKFAKALSIEQPLLGVEFNEMFSISQLYIQSQDSNTIIEDIIINRGNCAVVKYKTDYDMESAYRELNGNKLKTKSGQSVEMVNNIWSDNMGFYNSLDDDSKSIYKPTFPVKLTYGKKFIVPYWYVGLFDYRQSCKIEDIIEVEVVVNGGGSIVYKPKEMLLF